MFILLYIAFLGHFNYLFNSDFGWTYFYHPLQSYNWSSKVELQKKVVEGKYNTLGQKQKAEKDSQ